MRKPPVIQPPSTAERDDPERKSEVRHYKVITPLFGGGVEPNQADPITTVRATEVRAHLRFWWRAIVGGSLHDVEELRQRESSLWGSTEEESRVQVRLIEGETKSGRKEVAFQSGT